MPIYVDDIELQADAETLKDAILAAKERLDAAGRIIVEIKVAGQPLVGDEIEEHVDDYIADTDVHLVSADPKAEAISALEQIRSHLTEAGKVQADVADLLQRDEQADAMKTIGGSLAIWQQTSQGIAQCAAMMNVSLEAIEVEGKSFADLTTQLKLRLNELYEYLTNNDTVAVADTLAYEWPDLVQGWQAMVGELIDTIQKQ